MNRSRSNQGGTVGAPAPTNSAGGGPKETTVKLTLEQWSNQLAPLSDAEKASVSKLSEWLDRQTSREKRKVSVSVAKTSEDRDEQDKPASIPIDAGPNRDAQSRELYPGESTAGPSVRAQMPSAPIEDKAAYDAWIASLEQHILHTAESSHLSALQDIQVARGAVDRIMDDIERAAVHVAELRAGCQYVEEGTLGLREDAESHMEKMDRLHELSEGLALRRSYFALLPNITRFLSTPSPDLALVLTPDFLHNLDKLDVALSFIAAHSHYKDAGLYKMRFEQCIIRAASLIRLWIFRWTTEWTTKTQEGLKTWQANRITKGKEKERPDWAQENDPRMVSVSILCDVVLSDSLNFKELAEPAIRSLFFDPDINEASQLQVLLAELEKRARPPLDSEDQADNEQVYLPEIAPILTECRSALFASRRTLLSGFVTASLARIEANVNASAAAAQSSSSNAFDTLNSLLEACLRFAMPLCAEEDELLSQLLDLRPEPDGPPNAQAEYGSHLHALVGTPIGDRLRLRLTRENRLDTLSKACRLLLEFDLPESPIENVDQALMKQAFAPALQEIRSRLIARVQAIATAHVANYTPEEEDLNYPAKVQSLQPPQSTLTANGKGHQRAASSFGGSGLLGAAIDAEQASDPSRPIRRQRLFLKPSEPEVQSWYPTFLVSFNLLAVVHDVLPAAQLREFGAQVVRQCLLSLEAASQKLQSKTSAAMDVGTVITPLLFLLRHVLLLRETLVSVDVAAEEMQSREKINPAHSSDGQTSKASRVTDLTTLVVGLGSLLDPRRLYGAPSSTTNSTELTGLRESALSKDLESRLHRVLATLCEQVARSACFPLQVFLDAAKASGKGGPSSTADTTLERAQSSLESFKTTSKTAMTNLDGALVLYIQDEAVAANIMQTTMDSLQSKYSEMLKIIAELHHITDLPAEISAAIGWSLPVRDPQP